jgi:hypothetical protein
VLAFRAAVEARDLDGLVASLHDDVVFRSPLLFKAVEGKAAVSRYLRAALEVLGPSLRYDAELTDGTKTALEFHATVAGKELHGIDLGVVDASGLVVELTVFVRPLTATLALGEAMRAALG